MLAWQLATVLLFGPTFGDIKALHGDRSCSPWHAGPAPPLLAWQLAVTLPLGLPVGPPLAHGACLVRAGGLTGVQLHRHGWGLAQISMYISQ
eukprot:803652-Pelagomonas_calceolata.AAC.8